MRKFDLFWAAMVVGAAGIARGTDWIVDPSGYKAKVEAGEEAIVLDNGLIRREIMLNPDAVTTSLKCVATGEEYVRGISNEATVTIDGTEYPVGGVVNGQPVYNYILPEWCGNFSVTSNAYRYAGFEENAVKARFEWKRRREWSSRELDWPPKGRELTLSFVPPTNTLPKVEVHYEIYDGAPIIAKWLVVRNDTEREIVVDTFKSECLRLTDTHANNDLVYVERPNDLWVMPELFFQEASNKPIYNRGMRYVLDEEYKTQVEYYCKSFNRLEVGPDRAFAKYLKPGESYETYRVWETAMDSTDRERVGLTMRRFWRMMAPWTDENPLFFHLRASKVDLVKAGIDQAQEAGFEAVLMSFHSGFNLESRDGEYRAKYAELSNEAKRKGLVLGGYTLTSSRSAKPKSDNVEGECRFGKGPCLGAEWGVEYFQTLKDFMREADFGIFENDGPYPGDVCSSTNHPYHHGDADSFRVQWEAQRDLYRFCVARGIHVNQPDSYYLNGGNKNGMGYKERVWSQPRDYQVLIERQNIYDGTWAKTSSMGWMFVPLTEYHGGGKAAIVEPLAEHLDHYEQRFADTLGAGVQAVWRGPRLYDTEETLAMVRKWTKFYKEHRRVLTGDFIHLRRADGRDWDGWMMTDAMNPVDEKAIAFVFNPLTTPIRRTISLPLKYTGLAGTVGVKTDDGETRMVESVNGKLAVEVEVPAKKWVRIHLYGGRTQK